MLVIYGSETGNAQDIAEELGKAAQRLHFKTKVEEMNTVSLNELLRYTLVICVISTTGQGDFPQNSLSFWKSLLRKKLPPSCLASVRFTSFGLGDSSYPKFNWVVRKLHKRLEQLGAKEFYPRGEGDEQDDDGIDEQYIRWSIDLQNKLLEQHPLPEGMEKIPREALLPPRYKLTIDTPSEAPSSEGPWAAHSNGVQSNGQPHQTNGGQGGIGAQDDQKGYVADAISKVPDPVVEGTDISEDLVQSVPEGVIAVLRENERVTPADHWQDVRKLRFDIRHLRQTSLKIKPGDCLKLFPRNFQEDVDRLIELMDWQAEADAPLDMAAMGELPTGLNSRRHTTLRQLLLHNLDITAVPRRSFLEAISHHCTDEYHKARLIEFTSSEYIDEYYDYATRSRRSIIEVLDEFHSVKIPVAYVLDVFPVIRGRDFSIAGIDKREPTTTAKAATTAAAAAAAAAPMEPGHYSLELLVAMVRYRTVLRKVRTGLCSRYLAPLAPGTAVLAAHKPSAATLHGPAHARRPLCALATGTGIAPVRALIQERLRLAAESATNDDGGGGGVVGPMHLFFGNRSRDKDFFFRNEWDAAEAAGRLHVHTAFSRDQRQKVYIQDAVRSQASVVARLAREDAIFLVCGGSAKMATACREVVTACLVSEGVCGTDEEARDYFARLTWWQEIW